MATTSKSDTSLFLQDLHMNLDKPSSGATGTLATLLSLARSDAKDSLEKSAIQCLGDTTLLQIVQDFDVVAILRVAMYFVHVRDVFLISHRTRQRLVTS